MDIVHIPVIGWIVIAFVAVLIFVILLLALRKGVRLGIGDKKLIVGAVGKDIDEKLIAFKGEIEQREKSRLKDEELRKQLFRSSVEIDERTKADNRRIIRKLTPDIQAIFAKYSHCEFTATSAVEIIKDELTERIDYNCIRERLSTSERQGYIADILHHIKSGYEMFLLKIPRVPCEQESYPAWKEIKPAVELLINTWASETVAILRKRITEKIDVYNAERDNFILPENKDNAVDYPVRKNKQYIKQLGD